MKDWSFGIIPIMYKGGEYKFLLVQHVSDGGIGAHWSFPKGHKKGEEEDKDTAMRELKEETGINNVKILADYEIIERYFFMEGGERIDKTVKYFLGLVRHIGKIRVPKGEIFNYKWATFDEATKTITFDDTKKTLQKAYEYLISNQINDARNYK